MKAIILLIGMVLAGCCNEKTVTDAGSASIRDGDCDSKLSAAFNRTSCPPGQTMCGSDRCQYLIGNEKNCNGCGNTCDPGKVCLPSGCGDPLCSKPKTEVCNGIDDDCDGTIDETVDCSRPVTCTIRNKGDCIVISCPDNTVQTLCNGTSRKN